MNNSSAEQESARENLILMVLIGLLIAVGASFYLIPSPLAPALVLGGAAGVIVFFAWLRRPVWAVYFAIFVVLLPNSLIPADVNSLLNRAATMVAFGVWIIDFIVHRRKIVLSLSTVLMMGFLLWSVVTYTWAPSKEDARSLILTYTLRWLLFLLLIGHEIRAKKDLVWLMNILALSGALLEVVSLVSIATQGYVTGTRLKVLNVNENELGLSLLMSLPAVLWWAMRPAKRFAAIKMGLAALFLLVAIALTGLSGSRGSAISLGMMILISLVWKSTRRWGFFAIVMAAAAFLVAPSLFATTIERFLVASGDTALGGREYLWPAGFEMIRDHLFFGVGIGNSPYEVIPYLIQKGAPWVTAMEPLHNPVLVIWAETGLVGLVLYLSVLATALLSFAHEYLKTRKMGLPHLNLYFELMACMIIGFLASWIKGGGMESSFSHFLVISFLLIPSSLNKSSFQEQPHA